MVKSLSLFTVFTLLAVLDGLTIEDNLVKDPISVAESAKEDDPNKVDRTTTLDDLTATVDDPKAEDVPTAEDDPTTVDDPSRVYDFNFVKQAMTWYDADEYCKRWGGRLVTVESAIENAYIRHEQQRRWMGSPWIGYNDRYSEGRFTWLYANSCNNKWTNWRHGEPNGGRRENCVEMWDGKWNDLPCDWKRHFVCHRVKHCYDKK